MEIIKDNYFSYSFKISFIPRNFVPTLHPKEVNNLLVSPLRLYKDCNNNNNELNFIIDKSNEEEKFGIYFPINIKKSNVNKKQINTILNTLIEKNKLKKKV